MTTSEKVAYLKGFADGLGLDKENKQDKLIAAIIDVLDTVAQDLDELEETTYDLGAEIGKHQPAGRSHDHVGELDDADAVERQGRSQGEHTAFGKKRGRGHQAAG